MKTRKPFLLPVLFLALPVFGQGLSEVAPRHEQAVRLLIKNQISTGSLDNMYVDASELVASATKANIQSELKRELSDSEEYRLRLFWHKTLKEIIPYSVIEDALLPATAKHLTYDEVTEINRFYSTTIGKKFSALQPIIAREAAAALDKALKRSASPELRNSIEMDLKIQFPHWFQNN